MRLNHPLIVLLLFTLMVLTPLALTQREKVKSHSHGSLTLLVHATAEAKNYQLDLEEYLVGVLAAEMPAEFHLEALKAQAVAARTLAVRRLKRFGGRGSAYHPEADFSDDPNECQAWASQTHLRQKWKGWDFHKYHRKIHRAVRETAGIILVYNRRPIDAVYHSTCGTGTVNADEVWRYRLPYLVRTDCGFDRHSPRYQSQIFFTWNQLAKALNLPEKAVKSIKLLNRTASGRVGIVSLGKHQMSGTQLRTKLKLNSNCFSWEISRRGIGFRVIGYGHGVGMCQYGADGMAKRGYDYRSILRHYYRGVRFARLKY